MSDYKKKILEIIESDLTAYQIHKKTGLSQNAINGLRKGERDIDNLTLKTTERIYKLYQDLNN
ncbi:hypothetical protein [Staphylococcus capitis]|uniref:HTH cro/C1-type domain-containing protein n=1 Tax=Staphylococcus capitis TaxID=29388 RepID=A0ABX1STS8_STACP|nr:hypothetical protein [Staphylococcus capitis]NMK54641.1 hypothetical protein [Staphylococcus capitis]NMK69932.1 hypothetical protein [Staphylococcus capitis]